MILKSKLRLHYPVRTVALDYFYTLLGLLFTVTPLTVLTPVASVTGVLAGCALLFFLFGLRTAIRHHTFVEVSDRGVTLHSLWGADMAWCELLGFKLRYFSTRRRRQEGWMLLHLRGKNRTIRVDSTLEEFDKLVARVATEARRNKLSLAADTVQNLFALGLTWPPEETPKAANGSVP